MHGFNMHTECTLYTELCTERASVYEVAYRIDFHVQKCIRNVYMYAQLNTECICVYGIVYEICLCILIRDICRICSRTGNCIQGILTGCSVWCRHLGNVTTCVSFQGGVSVGESTSPLLYFVNVEMWLIPVDKRHWIARRRRHNLGGYSAPNIPPVDVDASMTYECKQSSQRYRTGKSSTACDMIEQAAAMPPTPTYPLLLWMQNIGEILLSQASCLSQMIRRPHSSDSDLPEPLLQSEADLLWDRQFGIHSLLFTNPQMLRFLHVWYLLTFGNQYNHLVGHPGLPSTRKHAHFNQNCCKMLSFPRFHGPPSFPWQ